MVMNDEDDARLKVTDTAVDPVVATANGRDQFFDELSDRINALLEQLRGSMLGSASISKGFAAGTVINSELNSHLKNTTVAVTQQQAMAPSRALFVFIENQTRTLSEDDLLPIFSIHGGLERIVLLRKNPNLQVLILYDDIDSAISAMDSLHGKYIYDGCCELCIEFSDKFVARGNLGKDSEQRTGVQGMCLMKYGGEYFETMPIILASVHNQLYPITVEVLHQVFDAHGEVKEIEIVDEFPTLQVWVKYHSSESAVAARNALDGVNIYVGCCQLEVELLYQKIVEEPSLFKQNGAYNLQEDLVDEKWDATVSEISMDEVQNGVNPFTGIMLPSTCLLSCQMQFSAQKAMETWYVGKMDGKYEVEQHFTVKGNNNIIDTTPSIETLGNLDIEPWPNWKHLRATNTGVIRCSTKRLDEMDGQRVNNSLNL